MDPRFRNYLVLVVVLVIGLATALAVAMGGAGRRDPNQPPDGPAVIGVVVGVQSQGLTDVVSFTIRTEADTNRVFLLDKLKNGTAFPPGHLVEHQASSAPIQVWYVTEGGVDYAIWLADAPESG